MNNAPILARIEQQIIARLTEAFTLAGETKTVIEVAAWPDRPNNTTNLHPVGECLLAYLGAQWQHSTTNGGSTNRDLDFTLRLSARTLREHHAKGGEVLDVGIYSILNQAQRALTGWQPPDADGIIYLGRDRFAEYREGVWFYEIDFKVRVFQPINTPDVIGPYVPWGENPPLLKEVNLNDEYQNEPN